MEWLTALKTAEQFWESDWELATILDNICNIEREVKWIYDEGEEFTVIQPPTPSDYSIISSPNTARKSHNSTYWKASEDEKLSSLVDLYNQNWEAIAEKLPNKTIS